MDSKVSKKGQSQADELEERLIDFAVRIVKLSAHLPRTAAVSILPARSCVQERHRRPITVKHVALRAKRTLFHKVRIVLKELNETSIWLRVIQRSNMLRSELIVDIIGENKELCRIFARTVKTARR